MTEISAEEEFARALALALGYELAVLSRLMARNALQHRSAKHFQVLRKVARCGAAARRSAVAWRLEEQERASNGRALPAASGSRGASASSSPALSAFRNDLSAVVCAAVDATPALGTQIAHTFFVPFCFCALALCARLRHCARALRLALEPVRASASCLPRAAAVLGGTALATAAGDEDLLTGDDLLLGVGRKEGVRMRRVRARGRRRWKARGRDAGQNALAQPNDVLHGVVSAGVSIDCPATTTASNPPIPLVSRDRSLGGDSDAALAEVASDSAAAPSGLFHEDVRITPLARVKSQKKSRKEKARVSSRKRSHEAAGPSSIDDIFAVLTADGLSSSGGKKSTKKKHRRQKRAKH